MIRAAFYAPMKPPTHGVPSGDRAMARALVSALAAAGIQTDLASELRTRDGAGDARVQEALLADARTEMPDIIASGRAAGWRVWITYHNYYKAPDLLGPEVARDLGIPYIQIESTRAKKKLDGPWKQFAEYAEAATEAAAVVFYLTRTDEEALRNYAPAGQRLVHLPPFLPSDALPPETDRSACLLSVGMFRPGDKLASYKIIAETLSHLRTPDWHLEIAGDGAARDAVTMLMSPFGERVKFLGEEQADGLQNAYGRARILLWPGVNEAFGMSYLEAQASGLPVVSQDRPGVQDVLAPNAAYPPVDQGAAGLAARLDFLLSNEKLVKKLGEGARAYIADNHLLPAASLRLRREVDKVLET